MKLFNSLTKQKEEFIPINKNKILMYVCGQTVYDYCHLGHGRKAIVFDMIRRWFLANDYDVVFVENITDIDDKIINKAYETKESIQNVTAKYIQYMHEDFTKLNILKPTFEPKATDYISNMIVLIQDLINKNYAYQAVNNDVYYSVKNFIDYGKLSGKKIQDLYIGERVEIDNYKNDPLDFVLWKSSKDNEPYWDSPFGKGRPGWHIECSAMANEILGKTFDIHAGGQDLQFPHHENEIAQSEAHNNCKLANYWLHNGYLNIKNIKMSKSLGNFYTIRQVLENYHPEVIRMFILKTHYRSPINFDYDIMDETKNSLSKIYLAIKDFDISLKDYLIDWNNQYAQQFKTAMNDDFNTPIAIAVIFSLTHQVNITHNLELAKLLIALSNILGLIFSKPNEFFHYNVELSDDEIHSLIEKRKQAKREKNFHLADEIRANLNDKGILLEDSNNDTTWRKI